MLRPRSAGSAWFAGEPRLSWSVGAIPNLREERFHGLVVLPLLQGNLPEFAVDQRDTSRMIKTITSMGISAAAWRSAYALARNSLGGVLMRSVVGLTTLQQRPTISQARMVK